MNYNTVYIGMDVHKESFTLCAFTIEADKGKYHQKTEPDLKKVLKYLEFLRSIYGNDCLFHSVNSVVSRMFFQMNKSKNFTPGFIMVLHTFGRDLKWNP